uniref:Uncharacterized protein n=1 Tax=Anguilla anguilla TaxID=7936 RepID=A0A0E9UJQ6_ANGAN
MLRELKCLSRTVSFSIRIALRPIKTINDYVQQ